MEFGSLNYIWYMLSLLLAIMLLSFGLKKKLKIKEKLGLNLQKQRELLSNIGIIISIFLIAFSLIQPRVLKDFEKVEVKGLDIYILIDVSKSMLVEDVIPNRLEKAKESIKNLLENLKGDRVGFIPFSGSAYIQMPLTDDYNMASLFLDVIDTELISGGGTNIEAALKLAEKSFDATGSSEKIVLVISDGDEHDNDSIEFAKTDGKDIKIYSLGIGTKEGGLIPEIIKGAKKGFVKDENGSTVVAKLSSKTLNELALIGNGEFYLSDNFNEGVDKFIMDIVNLKRDTNREEKIKKYRELYQYFLFTGVLLFLISYFGLNIKKQEEV